MAQQVTELLHIRMAFLRMIDTKRQNKRIDLCLMGKRSINQISYRRRASMKLRDILTVVGTAGITMAATLMLLGPRNSSPAYAAPEVKAVIAQPEFQSQGCKFVLKTDRATYEAGQSPIIELTASNPSDNPVNTTVWVSITASAPEFSVSRMAPMPRTLWMHECGVSLLPNETRKIVVPSDAKPQAGQNILIIMTDKKETIRLANPAIRANAESARSELNTAQGKRVSQ
jgi:hypothetical protein